MDSSVSLAMAFAAGLFSFLSPCVLPLVPSYLGFITGMSLDDLEAGERRGPVMANALLFVGGFSLVFLAMGASASFLGQMLIRYQEWIARIGGIIIILFGLHLLGVLRIRTLLREWRPDISSTGIGYAGAGVAGIAFGAGWTPCVGPVLGAVLMYAGVSATMGSGMLLLGSYALGLAVPFLLAALLTARFLDASRRFRRFIPVLEKAAGAILVLAGILLASGMLTVLFAYFARLTPEFLLERM